ncbi:unnamed protein product, partial [Chrysoparadoxa australica]
MFAKIATLFALLLGCCNAFVAPSAFAGTQMKQVQTAHCLMPILTFLVPGTMVMEDTYWEGKAPPSSVLGNWGMQKESSLGLAIKSMGAFMVGVYSIHESNIAPFGQLSVDHINPAYVAGALLVPISWGLHVVRSVQGLSFFDPLFYLPPRLLSVDSVSPWFVTPLAQANCSPIIPSPLGNSQASWIQKQN